MEKEQADEYIQQTTMLRIPPCLPRLIVSSTYKRDLSNTVCSLDGLSNYSTENIRFDLRLSTSDGRKYAAIVLKGGISISRQQKLNVKWDDDPPLSIYLLLPAFRPHDCFALNCYYLKICRLRTLLGFSENFSSVVMTNLLKPLLYAKASVFRYSPVQRISAILRRRYKPTRTLWILSAMMKIPTLLKKQRKSFIPGR